MASGNIEGVTAVEPGSFAFPEGEVPEVIPRKYPVPVQGIGDNIPSEPSDVPAWDFWRRIADCMASFRAEKGLA